MILTDKGNRKPKEEKKPAYHSSTYEELVARVEAMKPPKPKPGLEYILDMDCNCGIKLPDDVEEDTQQAVWFYENPKNHGEDCDYIFWERITLR